MTGIVICPICLEKIGESEITRHSTNSTEKEDSNCSGFDSFLTSVNPTSSTYPPGRQFNQEVKVTRCGHIFHSICIRNWLEEGKSECPTCRGIINPNKIMKIYPQFLSANQNSEIQTQIQRQLRNSIFENMDSIQTTICFLEEKINKICSNKKIIQFHPIIGTSSSSVMDRVADLLKRKPKPESSLEKEIIDLKEAIEIVNKKMTLCGKNVSQLTGVPKNEKGYKQLVSSLAKINRLMSEDHTLRHTLEKRVFQLKPKETVLKLNQECNRLSKIAEGTLAENSVMKRDISHIVHNFGEVKKAVAKTMEHLICLQNL